MQKDESMKWPFASEDMADNLIEWAGKIKALGEVWGALSWHVDRYDGDGEALTHCGETLGMIIGDYAGLIEDTVTENLSIIRHPDENTISPLTKGQEAYDFIGEARRVEDLIIIEQHLNELKSFFANVSMPAVRLTSNFENLKKEIMAQQKSAPAAVAAAAGA